MKYDIFVSYAHSDNEDGWIDSFVNILLSTYRKMTGVSPSIFLDRESLITSDIWDKKIQSALRQSSIMVAVVSPSYILSEWCRKEWSIFVEREIEMRSEGVLPDEQGLLFPILLYPLKRGRFGDNEKRFVADVSERQWMDVSSQLEGNPLRPNQIRELAESIIDSDAETKIRQRNSTNYPLYKKVIGTIRDANYKIEWAAELSPRELTPDEARKYVAQLGADDGVPWRLPTKKELKSVIIEEALSDDPKASPFPLRPPFNSQRFGYLQSGTKVFSNPDEGHYIMNVRNGHIFNGKGKKCFIRVVREIA